MYDEEVFLKTQQYPVKVSPKGQAKGLPMATLKNKFELIAGRETLYILIFPPLLHFLVHYC